MAPTWAIWCNGSLSVRLLGSETDPILPLFATHLVVRLLACKSCCTNVLLRRNRRIVNNNLEIIQPPYTHFRTELELPVAIASNIRKTKPHVT